MTRAAALLRLSLAAPMLVAPVLAAPATAQVAALPTEAQAALRASGTAMGPDAIRAAASALAPLHPREDDGSVVVTSDARYGADPRHRLDVFAPRAAGGARPVLMFVHGGGFIAGDKRRDGSFYYQNIGLWAARSGLVGVNVTYRLAPQHPWPAGAEDVAAAVAWVRANAARFGGDPGRIVLMGHSAGASHVATYVAKPEFHPPGGSGLAGAVLVSGVYDLATNQGSALQYYGSDPAALTARSTVGGLAASALPLLLLRAEFDPPYFQRQATTLEAALCGRGPARCTRAATLAGHTHFSTTFAMGTADRSLSDPVLGFTRGLR